MERKTKTTKTKLILILRYIIVIIEVTMISGVNVNKFYCTLYVHLETYF